MLGIKTKESEIHTETMLGDKNKIQVDVTTLQNELARRTYLIKMLTTMTERLGESSTTLHTMLKELHTVLKYHPSAKMSDDLKVVFDKTTKLLRRYETKIKS